MLQYPLKKLCVLDVESGKMTGNLPLESRPFSLAYSPDGKYLISGEANGTVTIIDAEKMVEKVSFQKQDLYQYMP